MKHGTWHIKHPGVQEYFPGVVCTTLSYDSGLLYLHQWALWSSGIPLSLLASWVTLGRILNLSGSSPSSMKWQEYVVSHGWWEGKWRDLCWSPGEGSGLSDEFLDASSLGPCRNKSLGWWRWNPWTWLGKLMTLNGACGKGVVKLLLGSSWLFVEFPLSARPQEKLSLRAPELVYASIGPSLWHFWASVEHVSGL